METNGNLRLDVLHAEHISQLSLAMDSFESRQRVAACVVFAVASDPAGDLVPPLPTGSCATRIDRHFRLPRAFLWPS